MGSRDKINHCRVENGESLKFWGNSFTNFFVLRKNLLLFSNIFIGFEL